MPHQFMATHDELQHFVHHCLPAAYGSTPTEYWDPFVTTSNRASLISEFRCSAKDQALFEAFMKAF
jgi:hypothetical protein